MPTTKAFEAISLTSLGTVTGGCHKRCCPPSPPAAPQPMAAPAPQDSGPLVSTNVQINGYGAPAQASA